MGMMRDLDWTPDLQNLPQRMKVGSYLNSRQVTVLRKDATVILKEIDGKL